MAYKLFLVALGGAAGSVARYLVQLWLNTSFPFGTLLVNATGCFLIGLLWGLLSRELSESMRLLLMTGFCGGFTTFSSFTYESMDLLLRGRWPGFLLYTCGSVVAGLMATFAGFKLTN